MRDERVSLGRLSLCLAALGACQMGLSQPMAQTSEGGLMTTQASGDGATGTDAGGRRADQLTWRVETSLLVSDNISARSSDEGKDAGALLRLAPGLRYAHKGGGAEWLIDYSLQGQRYVRTDQQGKPFQNSLRANARFEVLGPALLLDGAASIAQRTRSAFDIQRSLGDIPLGDTNEVANASLGPTLTLRLSPGWRAVVKHSASLTRARGTQVGDNSALNSQISLEQSTRSLLTWGGSLSHQETRPTEGRKTDSIDAKLNLTWRPDVDWSVSTHVGRERGNLQVPQRSEKNTFGANVVWTPSTRTRAQLSGNRRAYGDFHTISLDHRFTRAAIRLSDSRSVNQAGAVGASVASTAYDLYFAQLAAQAPDPVERDALVRQRLLELGLAPDALVANGFLSSQPSVSRVQSLGVTYQQARALWTMNLTKTRTSRLGTNSVAGEDLLNSSFVDASSAQGGLTYRLTPRSAVRIQASWQRNEGDNANLQRNELRSVVLGWQLRLSRFVLLAAGLRHSDFESPIRSFTENAMLVNVQQRF